MKDQPRSENQPSPQDLAAAVAALNAAANNPNLSMAALLAATRHQVPPRN